MARRFLVVLAALLEVWAPRLAAAQSPPATGAVNVRPEHVSIDLLYDGVTLEVRAEVPSGYEAVVRLEGSRGPLVVKKKAKQAGVLWMSAGEVAFEDVPAVYQVLTSAPLAELGERGMLTASRIDYMGAVPATAEAAPWRDELVKLKEHQGLFAIHERALSERHDASCLGSAEPRAPGAPDGAARCFVGRLRLPALAPPGDYQVELIGLRGGEAARLSSTGVRLERTGATLAMWQLASEHGLLYGGAAVVIAIVAGLLCGFLFRSKSDESH